MKEKKKSRFKIAIVVLFIIITAIGIYVSYRSNYLQTLEIGEEYLDVFYTNMKYKYTIITFNFVLFFAVIFIENILIKN